MLLLAPHLAPHLAPCYIFSHICTEYLNGLSSVFNHRLLTIKKPETPYLTGFQGSVYVIRRSAHQEACNGPKNETSIGDVYTICFVK
jgi:hypothetical protein